MVLPILVQNKTVQVFRSLLLWVLPYSCKTSTLTGELKGRLNFLYFAESVATESMTICPINSYSGRLG